MAFGIADDLNEFDIDAPPIGVQRLHSNLDRVSYEEKISGPLRRWITHLLDRQITLSGGNSQIAAVG